MALWNLFSKLLLLLLFIKIFNILFACTKTTLYGLKGLWQEHPWCLILATTTHYYTHYFTHSQLWHQTDSPTECESLEVNYIDFGYISWFKVNQRMEKLEFGSEASVLVSPFLLREECGCSRDGWLDWKQGQATAWEREV